LFNFFEAAVLHGLREKKKEKKLKSQYIMEARTLRVLIRDPKQFLFLYLLYYYYFFFLTKSISNALFQVNL